MSDMTPPWDDPAAEVEVDAPVDVDALIGHVSQGGLRMSPNRDAIVADIADQLAPLDLDLDELTAALDVAGCSPDVAVDLLAALGVEPAPAVEVEPEPEAVVEVEAPAVWSWSSSPAAELVEVEVEADAEPVED